MIMQALPKLCSVIYSILKLDLNVAPICPWILLLDWLRRWLGSYPPFSTPWNKEHRKKLWVLSLYHFGLPWARIKGSSLQYRTLHASLNGKKLGIVLLLHCPTSFGSQIGIDCDYQSCQKCWSKRCMSFINKKSALFDYFSLLVYRRKNEITRWILAFTVCCRHGECCSIRNMYQDLCRPATRL
jgi:hypothetical protein